MYRERAGKYYIIDVSPGGAAARSGAVKAGDVLHAVDGTAVRGLDQVPACPLFLMLCVMFIRRGISVMFESHTSVSETLLLIV